MDEQQAQWPQAATWETCDAVERHADRLSGARCFVVPISALLAKVNAGAMLDEFLSWFPGVERARAEKVIDFRMRRLQDVVRRVRALLDRCVLARVPGPSLRVTIPLLKH